MSTLQMMTKDELDALKPGDPVTRWLSGVIPVNLTVTNRTDSLIQCDYWDFHPDTGCEVDEDLGWDGVTKTGSYLTAGHAPEEVEEP